MYDAVNDRRLPVQCLVSREGFLPVRAHPTDAGADLKASLKAPVLKLEPGEQELIDTGVAVKIWPNYVGLVFNRSSNGKKGLVIPHGVGVIDSDYRGNLLVLLKNISDKAIIIEDGQRIAQLVIMPVVIAEFVDTWNDTKRGTGGFGSTNK